MPDARTATVERATAPDASEIAGLYLASRAEALPYLRRVHSDDDVHRWIRDVLVPTSETFVIRLDGRIAGFLALRGEELDQLYVLPGLYRRGIGSRLLLEAKRRSPRRLALYTFARNARARAFYEAHGFRTVDESDGRRNEEREPDVRYEWTGAGARSGA